MKIIILLAILLQSMGLAFSEMKKVQLLTAEELSYEVHEFDEVLEIRFGEIEKETLEKKPYLRILQAEWLTILNREADEKTYTSYFPVAENKDGKKYAQFERAKKSYPTDESLMESEYGKNYGIIFVRGATIYEHENKKYCVIDFTYDKEGPKRDVVATLGVYEEGHWRLLNEIIRITPSVSLPISSINVLKKGAESGFLFKDPENNSVKSVELNVLN